MFSSELTSKPRRVVVIEHDPRYRSRLERLVAGASGFRNAASFPSAEPALRRAAVAVRGEELAWDVVVMDLELPGVSGIEATRRLKRLLPRLQIVILTVFEEPATIIEAICAGADGYMLKKTGSQEILEGLRAVTRGGAPLGDGVARRVLEIVRRGHGSGVRGVGERCPNLTEREQDVLRGLVEGLSYRQTADTLGISLGTVRTHVTAVYRKLEVHSVAAAVRRAIQEPITLIRSPGASAQRGRRPSRLNPATGRVRN